MTLLCETPARLREPLPDPHRRARRHARARAASASCCPPATSARRRSREHAEGLVCLSGCARHGLGVVDPNAAARLARAFPGAFYVELQRPYERGDARRNAALRELAGDARRPDRRDRRRARAPPAPRAAPGRARRDPQPHLARRLRARAPRQPRGGPALAGGDARAAAARRGAAHARGRRPLRVRPDAGARLPLPRLLRRRRPGRRAAARDLRPRLRRALRERERPQAAARASGSTTSSR